MKTIALLPFKNEAWILPAYLSSVSKFADEIIALDDSSTDEGSKFLTDNGVIVEKLNSNEKFVNLSFRREFLLKKGRERRGTHFIWLDADETFTSNFKNNFEDLIKNLRPGQKLLMPLICLWKSPYLYRNDSSVWSNRWIDFIVYDSPDYNFKKDFLSEKRTPGPNYFIKKINMEHGAVLHYQFIAWKRFQIKQAWYRCTELIEGSKSPEEINYIYSFTLDEYNEHAKLASVPKNWLEGIEIPENIENTSSPWHIEEMLQWFDTYGIDFFEPLQIWHVEEIRNEFIKRLNREPMVSTYKTKIIKSRQKKDVIIRSLKNKIRTIISYSISKLK